jgi:hypothetical protein
MICLLLKFLVNVYFKLVFKLNAYENKRSITT